MKYLIAILVLCSTVSASVRNTGSTTRDSVCIYVTCLDSVGKMSTCDSFYVRVIKSGTNAVVFSDSGTAAMTGLDSISGKSEYYYHRAVADIDGSGDDGEYILAVVAKKTAGSGWPTPNSRIFEIQNKLIFDQMKIVSTSDTAVVFATSASGKPAFARMNTNASGAAGSNGDYASSANREAVKYYASSSSSTAASAILYQSASNGAPAVYIYNSNGSDGIYYYDGTFQGSFLPVGYMGIGTVNATAVADNAIGAGELADDAAREIASHILKDTTKRIGVKGGLGDSVLTPIPTVTVGDVTLAAGQFTKIKDTVNIAANIVAARDSAGLGVRKDSSGLAYRVDSSGLSVRKDSSGLAYRSQPDSITQKQAKIILGDTTKRVFSGILNDTTKRIKFSNDSVVAIDPIRTVAATVSGGATEATAQKAVDSIHAVHQKVEAVRDTAHIIDSIVQAISPILTQVRDSINALSTWLDPTLDSLLYASGFKVGSRSIQGVSNDCDTLHVKIGTTPWFKMLFYHVGGTPGARPDSTITVSP